MSFHNNNLNTLLIKSIANHGINVAEVVRDIVANYRQLLLAIDSIDNNNHHQWMELVEILQAVPSIDYEPQLLEDIAKDICITLLCKLERKSNFQMHNEIGIRLHHNTAKVLITCCWHPGSKDTLPNELQCIIGSISNYINDAQGKSISKSSKGIEITTAVELIDSIISYQGNVEEAIRSSLANWNDKIVTHILDCLPYGDNEIIDKLTFRILPKLCELELDNLATLGKIWIYIKRLYHTEVEAVIVKESVALSLVCSLADFYLTADPESTILSNDEFWQILQTGLMCYNSLTRKRAIYLMRYALDVLEKENMSINVDQRGT